LSLLPDRYGCFLQARIKWIGPYPYPPEATDNFRAYVVVSTPPGMPPDPFLPPIEADAARSGVRKVESYSTGVTNGSPYLTPSGKLVPFLALIENVVEAHYPGLQFAPLPTFARTTTSIYFRRNAIPAYRYSPVPFNMTNAARRHVHD